MEYKKSMESLENLFHSLEEKGWGCADGALPADLRENLFLECQKSWQEGLFSEAQIGRGENKSRHADIRGDSILWLDADSTASGIQNFLTYATNLRQILNARYFLGLKSQEFHFARYPAGTAYQKHLDEHRGQNQRKISLVLYLNPQWSTHDGGELCLYAADSKGADSTRVLPKGGRLVLFRSDLIPHEVLTALQTRWSLTGWFRTGESA
jgi:SM-20-related protein